MEEHCIDIKGTVNPRNPNIVKKLDKAISELHSFHPDLRPDCRIQRVSELHSFHPDFRPDCRIQRVSGGLRRAKREAYEPIVVSIGPYHLKNRKLQAMKNHKLWYLDSLLKRRKEENVKKYIVEMEKLEVRVRNCYVEPIHDLNSEQFVEMMLLDACFIIEFFRRESRNAILNVDCMEEQIFRDLMLLENQLPFFLLSHFFDMTKDPEDPEDSDRDDIENPNLDPDKDPFLEMAKSIFIDSHSIPEQYLKLEVPLVPKEIKHLLHLVHVLCHRPLTERTARLEKIKTMLEIRSQMRSAVELEEAGVKFLNSNTNHLFDIKFEDGLMELPHFTIDHRTDTFFRNLIAFEQHSDVDSKYFTGYAYFMDQLINSEIDVKLLRDKGIIENYLGDDKEASNLFNKLCDGVITYVACLDEVFNKVDDHCNKPLNRIRAKLVRAHNYFDTPFATASTIAAVVLLVLTLLQTIAVFIYK